MSITEKVHDLVEHIKGGKILDGFNKHYAGNVSMRENRNPPAVGKAANLEREKQFLASVKEWKSLNIAAVAVSEEGPGAGTSFIEYDFDFVNTDGQPVHYEQVSVQRWQGGKIVEERFYYDTGA